MNRNPQSKSESKVKAFESNEVSWRVKLGKEKKSNMSKKQTSEISHKWQWSPIISVQNVDHDLGAPGRSNLMLVSQEGRKRFYRDTLGISGRYMGKVRGTFLTWLKAREV